MDLDTSINTSFTVAKVQGWIEAFSLDFLNEFGTLALGLKDI